MIDISLNKIKENIASFILVGLLFAGGWYYLDQQRIEAEKVKQEVIASQIKVDLMIKQYAESKKLLDEKQKLVEKKLQEQSRDKELADLTLKFIDESSSVNFHLECGDDPDHNAKARKAKALLDLIEAKAFEYGRKEILNNFVKKQRFGIGGWYANCKKP